MRKYWVVLSVALSERLIYRADFFFSTFLRFIPIITTILLWRAIFDGSGDERLGGLSYPDMVAYYLFIMISRAFGSMPGLASGIARDVREGDLRKFLLQPIDYLGYLITLRVAHKLVYYILAFIPFAIVFWICRGFLPGWPSPGVFGLYLVSLGLAFLLGFAVNALIGLSAFWFLEVNSLLYIFMIGQYFLSGHMFPLSLLPDGVRTVVEWLPFAYETYYPTLILVQHQTVEQVLPIIAGQLAWIIVLLAAGRLAWARGLRRYAAFGG